MSGPGHALVGAAVGAVAAVAPDAALALFGWRRTWLPESHPLVRAHRFLHSGSGLALVAVLAWASHVVIDRYSEHNEPP